MRKIGIGIIAGDSVIFLISLFVMLGVSFPHDIVSAFEIHIKPFSYLGILWLLLIYIFNGYDRRFLRPVVATLPNMLGLVFSWLLIGVAFFYFVPAFGITPRTNLLIIWSVFLLLYVVWRRLIYQFIVEYSKEPILFVGNHPRIDFFIQENGLNGLPFVLRGQYPDLQSASRDFFPGIVVVYVGDYPAEDIEHAVSRGVKLYPVYSFYEEIFEYLPIDVLPKTIPIALSQKTSRSILEQNILRCTEIIFAVVVLIITAPITILVAAIIYMTDRGPVFYTQERTGLFHHTFRLWKFRSMVVHAEKNGAVWSLGKSDSRVTWIGRIIRKLHIDEIPQMINILRGDIALVGPRPERPEFVRDLEKAIPYYNLRHIVRPGFTGWAQVRFRYARSIEDSARKLEYDLYYIKNRTIFLDFGCILKTVQIIFTH